MNIWSEFELERGIFGLHNCNGDVEERSRGLRRRERGRNTREFGSYPILRIFGFLVSFGDFEIFLDF